MNILHIMGTFRDNNTLTRIISMALRGGEKRGKPEPSGRTRKRKAD
jgi:hypothetical protein